MWINLTTELDPDDPSKRQLFGEIATTELLAGLNQLRHSNHNAPSAFAVEIFTENFDPAGEPGQECQLHIWRARSTVHQGRATVADCQAGSYIVASNMKQRRPKVLCAEELIYLQQDHVEQTLILDAVDALSALAQQRGQTLDRVGLLVCQSSDVWQAKLTPPR